MSGWVKFIVGRFLDITTIFYINTNFTLDVINH